MKVLESLILVAIFLYIAYTQLVKGQPRQDCQIRCGNVTIEYPFGISSGCYYPEDVSFNITCKEDKPYVIRGIEVKNFNHSGELRVLINQSSICYNEQGNKTDVTKPQYLDLMMDNLTFSDKNMFTAVGCDTFAYLNSHVSIRYSSGCMSVCNSLPEANGECSGRGCCQTPVPRGRYSFSVGAYSFNNHTSVYSFNPCSYAFLVETGAFNFDALEDLKNLRNFTKFPVILDWSIGSQTCEQVGNKSICGANSKCSHSSTRTGYICICNLGFEGNPYLSEVGCQGNSY